MHVLEALGHAPTLLNANSTRFAKFVDLNYSRNGELLSANIGTSMLEKSRVTLESANDRNYLLFYYMLSGLDKTTLDTLQLANIQKHRITKVPEGLSSYQSRQWNEKFFEWRQAMLNLSFSEEDLKTLYRLVAVIILLCDLEFQLVKDNTGNNKGNGVQHTKKVNSYTKNMTK